MFEALRRFFTGKTAEQLQAEKEERERQHLQSLRFQKLYLGHLIEVEELKQDMAKNLAEVKKWEEIERQEEEANGKPAAGT